MRRILLFVLCLAIAIPAFADGGRLRFSTSTGPFLVTLFTTPEPLTPGPSDFSILVQDAKTGAILNDAQLILTLTSGQAARAITASASHGIAANRLLQAAQINLPASGLWQLHLVIRQGSRSATLDTPIPVEPGSRQTAVIWTFAALPALAIFLFALHQRQRAQPAPSRFNSAPDTL